MKNVKSAKVNKQVEGEMTLYCYDNNDKLFVRMTQKKFISTYFKGNEDKGLKMWGKLKDTLKNPKIYEKDTKYNCYIDYKKKICLIYGIRLNEKIANEIRTSISLGKNKDFDVVKINNNDKMYFTRHESGEGRYNKWLETKPVKDLQEILKVTCENEIQFKGNNIAGDMEIVEIQNGKKNVLYKKSNGDRIELKDGKYVIVSGEKSFTKDIAKYLKEKLVSGVIFEKLIERDKEADRLYNYNLVVKVKGIKEEERYKVEDLVKGVVKKYLEQDGNSYGVGCDEYEEDGNKMLIPFYIMSGNKKAQEERDTVEFKKNAEKLLDKKKETIEYRGYYIDKYVTYPDMITVQYCGDDLIYNSVEEAKKGIDELIENDNNGEQ